MAVLHPSPVSWAEAFPRNFAEQFKGTGNRNLEEGQ